MTFAPSETTLRVPVADSKAFTLRDGLALSSIKVPDGATLAVQSVRLAATDEDLPAQYFALSTGDCYAGWTTVYVKYDGCSHTKGLSRALSDSGRDARYLEAWKGLEAASDKNAKNCASAAQSEPAFTLCRDALSPPDLRLYRALLRGAQLHLTAEICLSKQPNQLALLALTPTARLEP